jgi:beta-lactamase class A
MKTIYFASLLALLTFHRGMSAEPVPAAIQAKPSESLQKMVDNAAEKTLDHYKAKNLKTNELAISVIDLRDLETPTRASYRGDVQIYPASVIKLFYLAAAHRWMEDKKIEDTAELRRAMRDMIVDSLNEATGYIVDLLTDTTSGPELSDTEIKAWWDKRNAVNRYFTSLGYTNINVSKKPWCEGPYGRETQASRLFEPKRNWLTTDATARLMSEIVTKRTVTPDHCDQMMQLLKRDPFAKGDVEDQAHAFTGSIVPPGTRLWSKAGWTSEVRHDCAYVELPNGAKLVVVVFTVNHANDKSIVPFAAKAILDQVK